MRNRKKYFCALLSILIILSFTLSVSANSRTLKIGMSGSDVVQLQDQLKQLGFFPSDVSSTGYFGTITSQSVEEFQNQYGLSVDGIAGTNTYSQLDKLLNVSRGSDRVSSASDAADYMVPWFGKAENIFKIGDTATVYDIKTGLTYNLKRTFGYNHADCETPAAEDTTILLKTYGGDFSWDRRAVIVDVNGRKMAASVAAMPHAGREDLPNVAWADWRSGGYGAGSNLDAIKGNNMSGVIDVHFLNSKTHGTNTISSTHQEKVKEAAAWAEKNLN